MNAKSLTTLQRCARRYRLESLYRVIRIRPKELFDILLRQAIFEISSGGDAQQAAEEACTLFLERAARPGLDIIGDSYVLAQDYCAMLRTVLESVSRKVLLVLQPGRSYTIAGVPWQIEAFRDESGLLHRWTSVDKWDHDAMYREIHGWRVFGDCAAAQQGMWLHVVEIGRQTKGHQQSPWCRIYKHPAIQNYHRFKKKDGQPLEPSWKPLYFQSMAKWDAKKWVDQMQEDKLDLIHHLQIREPHPKHVEQFKEELLAESQRAAALPGDWQRIPMFRPSCDIPPCPFDPVCYAPPGLVNIEGIGGFAKL